MAKNVFLSDIIKKLVETNFCYCLWLLLMNIVLLLFLILLQLYTKFIPIYVIYLLKITYKKNGILYRKDLIY